VYKSLLYYLKTAQKALNKGQTGAAINVLNAFINEVIAQSGKHVTSEAAAILIADARWVINWIRTHP
jgi:hypothetical protein